MAHETDNAQTATLGAALDALTQTVAARRDAPADVSYTGSLLTGGPERCARKFAEEAIELVIATVGGDGRSVVSEAADVLYHFAVLLAAAGVEPRAVADELVRRRARTGLEEKAAR